MQGSGRSIRRQLQIALFGLAFTCGAVLIFALVFFIGSQVGLARLSGHWLYLIAGVMLILLAAVDVFAIKCKRYCPIGLPRQTPKALMHFHGMTTVCAVWGFDTGLAVTTFRVGALTWGALTLVIFGMTAWWVGVGYSLAFVVPLLILILTQGSNPIRRLEAMILSRSEVQKVSALILACTGLILIIKPLA